MKTRTLETKTSYPQIHKREKSFTPRPERTIEWLGGVNYENQRETLKSIKALLAIDREQEIHLIINSYGGATAIGMGFYDTVRSILKPNLVAIGSGEVDSSGIVVLLSADRRYVTKNTTFLLHMGGRTFDRATRFTNVEIENMLKESRLRDYQYACVLADATSGRSTPEKILELMSKETILNAEEAVNLGLAHKVLD